MNNESIFKETKSNTNNKQKQHKKSSNKKSKKKHNVDYATIQKIYTKQDKSSCKYYLKGKCTRFGKIQCRSVPYCEFYVKKKVNSTKSLPTNLLFTIHNKNIILKICIPTEQKRFKEYENNYFFQYHKQDPVKIDVYLTIEKNLDYDLITIIQLMDYISYENNTLFITIPKVLELNRIQYKPYRYIPNIIEIKYNKQIPYGVINISIKIHKKILFELITSQNVKNQNNEQNVKNQNNGQLNSKNTDINNTNDEQDDRANTINHSHNVHVPKYMNAIVLSDTRKCLKENHYIIDTRARVQIVMFNGKVIEYNIPAAYCEICNTFYVLKHDYKEAKKFGIILCQIEDRTQNYIIKHKNTYFNSWSGNESRIHQLGYNVQKNNGYTQEQRQTVLAYIMENTNISKHEIKSIIIKCINQHQNQDNFSQAVACWKSDLNFVNNYYLGKMPQVKIKKLIVK